ncbi:hypothetical protein MLD38_021144 [Melastoma candidum]|uniref:Uncharacterized protein n=1 Tax=Melastoma candidum TaxID=119954 RepID=A0ACB9QGZ8_9MYRT|nr:hypothetical protein MLD38_021144 [Melastoma candidum]
MLEMSMRSCVTLMQVLCTLFASNNRLRDRGRLKSNGSKFHSSEPKEVVECVEQFEILVLPSLFFQLLLASIAHQRRKSSNRFLILVIWTAYFVTDWATAFMFRLISNVQSVNPPKVDESQLTFWAAFLLIHLGDPDTITAFSLEDNALWTHHLVGLDLLYELFYTKILSLNERKSHPIQDDCNRIYVTK